MLFEEGLPAVFARHRRLAEAARRAVGRWAEAGALDFYVQEPAARSDAVTAVASPKAMTRPGARLPR